MNAEDKKNDESKPVENRSIGFRQPEEQQDNEPSDREALLNSFLSQITPGNTEISINTGNADDNLQTLTLDAYSLLPVPTEVEQKILELQAITTSIVKKEVDLRR